MASDSKTEKATPKKRRDERKKGNVLKSQDIIAVATLFASFAVLKLSLPLIVEDMRYMMTYSLHLIGTLPNGGIGDMLSEITMQSIVAVGKSVALPMTATILAAIVATFAQTRLLVTFESLKPDFKKLNPFSGIKRLFSLKSVVELLKNLIKITILLVIVYQCLSGSVQDFPKYLDNGIETSVGYLLERAFDMIIRIAGAFLVISFFDYLYQWWDFERQLKMSKEEVKEEYKQMEGDPKVKGKIKEIQRRMAQSRMMQQVPQADVVIRNPTHYAIALRYKPERDPAPIVVAKGVDFQAMRIVGIAQQKNIPTVENKPLARSLYASCEIAQEIPPEFYGAVAEVLAYIYRLNGKLP